MLLNGLRQRCTMPRCGTFSFTCLGCINGSTFVRQCWSSARFFPPVPFRFTLFLLGCSIKRSIFKVFTCRAIAKVIYEASQWGGLADRKLPHLLLLLGNLACFTSTAPIPPQFNIYKVSKNSVALPTQLGSQLKISLENVSVRAPIFDLSAR